MKQQLVVTLRYGITGDKNLDLPSVDPVVGPRTQKVANHWTTLSWLLELHLSLVSERVLSWLLCK